MKWCSFFILLSFAFSIAAQSKTDCTADRYEKDLFAAFNKQTIEYTKTKGWQDANQSLLADIYEPKDDKAELRPLVILVHGGSFVGGKKEQVAPFCTALVKKGYVAASIQYRLIPVSKVAEGNNILREVVRATNDLKAAIRFFRQSAANGNPYKIDANNIFIGGVSAGAITALQTGILDENDVITDELAAIIKDEGGFKGDTGTSENKKFSTKIKAIINLSGSIMDEDWIDKDDAPVFSYHGINDLVVPIEFNSIGTLDMFGSRAIKKQADKVGLENLLVEVPGGGHVDIYSPSFNIYLNDFQKQINKKMRRMICSEN